MICLSNKSTILQDMMVIISSSFFFLALIIIIVVYTAPGTMYDIVARIADDGENRFEIKCGDLGDGQWNAQCSNPDVAYGKKLDGQESLDSSLKLACLPLC